MGLKKKIYLSDRLDGKDKWHQYIIQDKTKGDTRNIRLECSGKRNWNLKKGDVMCKLKDTGDNVKINGITYDHDELQEMYLLLKYYHEANRN